MKSQTLQAASEIITKRLASLFPKPVQPENVSMTNLSKFISEGMVEAAHKEFHRSWRADPDKACSVLKRHIKAALLAALEHAVKEGEAREAFGVAEGTHVIVPVEPTREMIDMGGREIAFKTQYFGGARTLARYSSDDLELANQKRAYVAYSAMLKAYEE